MIITSTLKSSCRLGSTLLVSGLLLASAAQAQIATPAASPKSTVQQRVGLTDITVVYSRPSVKGRPIFGDSTTKAIAPFGQRWRTGANATTSIKGTLLSYEPASCRP